MELGLEDMQSFECCYIFDEAPDFEIRAFVHSQVPVSYTHLIILDDTTSAIDMETESMIQNELKKISDERTVFIIAHRISSIIHADQILVLDNGRLVERGTHEQLLDKKGYYSTVFHHQYGEFDRFKKVRAEKGRGEA